ncbi:JNK1/MAPK8-associated membrane protein [Copidosoma floridanum]|uniref:JNK1/MAPK8-associated membrane protein n=1 Tax=Copidosoma floridanum TaxID=29053 RepID=UPI0006C9E101|nr:JNK1/MAPK8-associated membrane protein [Copidosoma floridanum]XP_014217259.1 JNK1/MAPK8-associated membrane protein [Copidosoma floridanum]XP_014217260.1 JNK1/MAPK8-associated membrane protein [Copidosoma floridanum]
MNSLMRCPGLYCGREQLSDGNWTECGACPRGFRTNASSACFPCEDVPMFYDWLYLGFMALFALVLHWFSIDQVTMRSSIPKEVIALHLSALFEILAASVVTLYLTEPIGSFTINSCKVRRLSDWYTLLHNPSPNYETTLHCTHEAVYPLYTMIFVFYAFAVTIMLVVRPLIAQKCLPKKGKFSIYAALYFFPILALLHAVGSGLIYYAFPYITIVLSAISSAAHFAFKLNQTMKSLLLSSILDIKNVIVILGHWLLHGYGIVAIATERGSYLHPAMLALVPLPAIFYILTARFTDPHKLHFEPFI